MQDQLEETLAEIRTAGRRVTSGRRAVLGAVLDSRRHHFTAAEILTAVDKSRPRPDRATVYRTLELLTELGLLTPLQFDGEAAVYHRTNRPHGHLICNTCGAIIEIPETTVSALARTLHRQACFAIDVDRVVVSGSCQRCAAPGASALARHDDPHVPPIDNRKRQRNARAGAESGHRRHRESAR